MLSLDGVPDAFYDALGAVELRLCGGDAMDVDADLLRFGQHSKLQPELLAGSEVFNEFTVEQELSGRFVDLIGRVL